MKREELELFAREAAKGLKTEKDLNDFSQMLTKVVVEAALNVELDEHLGYSKHEKSASGNSRNGYTSKTLRTEDGQLVHPASAYMLDKNECCETVKKNS